MYDIESLPDSDISHRNSIEDSGDELDDDKLEELRNDFVKPDKQLVKRMSTAHTTFKLSTYITKT